MKLAAIDIGSNAIRFQISKVIEDQGQLKIKKLEFVRFPLRLGHDVFTISKISKEREIKFFNLMQAYKLLIDLYEVDHLMVCATSAMREATNGPEITKKIQNKLGLDIEVISGEEEASLINRIILDNQKDENIVHVDVGGGSTEINLYDGRKKIGSESFKIGSVRNLEGKDAPEVWKEMEEWVKKNAKNLIKPIAIGTGGNINKIYELSLSPRKDNSLSIKKFESLLRDLEDMTMEQRMNKLLLNPDRADVIVPASKIYLTIMKWTKSAKIIVPQVGLKDGMISLMIERHYKNWRKNQDKLFS